jgi:hypothetical protein
VLQVWDELDVSHRQRLPVQEDGPLDRDDGWGLWGAASGDSDGQG